ncbi:MAG: ATP-grasp domain-containing protein [Firmicutes bacterium]|nr:ATP-grasp domain-containing protein [Clostridiales bacterium]MBQ9931855.1 ATP-grasp domain-containing protein [Bacillota bacterium]
MFSKILVANRGEIAVRIIRACKEMGISTVAVYSEADAEALHVALADEAYCIGRADAADSYLNQERIISTALASGAEAIHPGYGFLSENLDFAKLCMDHDIVFIGPTVENMESLADKEQVRRKMAAAGLPIIPGSEILESLEEAYKEAKRIGYPVMLKSRSGGGGRGIRLVTSPEEMEGAWYSAASESAAAFGDDAVYMEKYINPSRHIEVQVLADAAGNVVCFGERDCSIQHRNQKLIEESPSPVVTDAQRKTLMRQVATAVESVGYVGVGTLEFLRDSEGHFYFMEMNVRLQVEHTVTECLTNMDLVKWQIRASAGILLNFRQEDIRLRGCAIECRINAKAPGTVGMLHLPGGPFVRFDTFLVSGAQITPYYDSLIGKLIVYAGTREEAIRKMKAALCELVIEGIPNNTEDQLQIVSSEGFASGLYGEE